MTVQIHELVIRAVVEPRPRHSAPTPSAAELETWREEILREALRQTEQLLLERRTAR